MSKFNFEGASFSGSQIFGSGSITNHYAPNKNHKSWTQRVLVAWN